MTTNGETVGLVLAGGGTKGAFEVGAIGYLVGEHQLIPDVITAASAGSIIASVLAQGRTHDELVALAQQLRSDLVAMGDLDVVFGRQPWLDDLAGTPFADAIEGALARRPAMPDAPDAEVAAALELATADRSHHRHRGLNALRAALVHAGSLHHARKDLPGNLTSFLTLDPLGEALRGTATTAGIAPVDPALVARAGLELRLAVTALGPGVTRYITQQGQVVEGDARTPCVDHTEPVDLVEAVLTSSSAPIVFPPRRWGEQWYNDGGVAQNIPVDAAAALGADHIVAVAAVPLYSSDPTDYSTSNFLAVDLRTSMISFLAGQRTSLAAPRADGARVVAVAPTVDVVGAFEVNPGLLHLDMDYGALRAQEVVAPLDDADRAAAMELTDRIIVARDHAWHLEEVLWNSPAGSAFALSDAHRRTILDAIRRCKREVAETVEARAALGLTPPMDASGWSTEWEGHTGNRPGDLPGQF